MEAGVKKNVDFDVKDAIGALCNTNMNPKFSDYSRAVRELCEEILRSPKHIDIVSRHFR